MTPRALIPLLAALLLAAPPAASLRAGDVPYLSGRVNDLAEILSPETRAALEALLKSHEDSTSNQIVVLTVPSLEGEEIESYSVRVAETWRLGQKGKDNGVLLLIAQSERKVRIEVGRGLEGTLTDLVAGQIIRREIVPRFRKNDYDGGVRSGVEAIISAVHGAYEPDSSGTGGIEPWWANGLMFAFFLLVVGIFTIIALLMPGCGAWGLYLFLLPFWFAFPSATLGLPAGLALFGLYAAGFPLLKLWYFKTSAGGEFLRRAGRTFAAGVASGSSWSSRGGGSSSGFSGGGGSFSGGGASGGW